MRVLEARGFGARRRGLAGLAGMPPATGLWIHRCRSVHTVGMRFALDLVWLDAGERVVRVDRDVAPRRTRGCLRARTVIETRAGEGERLAAAWAARAGERR
jgi:uncharacterized membrane protein (UPF0127 family)